MFIHFISYFYSCIKIRWSHPSKLVCKINNLRVLKGLYIYKRIMRWVSLQQWNIPRVECDYCWECKHFIVLIYVEVRLEHVEVAESPERSRRRWCRDLPPRRATVPEDALTSSTWICWRHPETGWPPPWLAITGPITAPSVAHCPPRQVHIRFFRFVCRIY